MKWFRFYWRPFFRLLELYIVVGELRLWMVQFNGWSHGKRIKIFLVDKPFWKTIHNEEWK